MVKSKEELEKDLLGLRIQSMNKALNRKEKKKLTAVILTVISIAAGLFSILFPSITFIKQQQEQYKFQFNKAMVGYVNDLNSSDKQKQELAVLMLSYFEKDAVRILLHKLERTEYYNKQYICNALNDIKKVSKKDHILIETMLLENTVDFHQRAYLHPFEKVYNEIDGLQNYIYVLGEIGNYKDKEIKDFLSLVQDSLPNIKKHQKTIDDINKEINACLTKLKTKNE